MHQAQVNNLTFPVGAPATQPRLAIAISTRSQQTPPAWDPYQVSLAPQIEVVEASWISITRCSMGDAVAGPASIAVQVG